MESQAPRALALRVPDAEHAGGPPFVSGNQGPDYRIELGFGLVRWVDQHEPAPLGGWELALERCIAVLLQHGDAARQADRLAQRGGFGRMILDEHQAVGGPAQQLDDERRAGIRRDRTALGTGAAPRST